MPWHEESISVSFIRHVIIIPLKLLKSTAILRRMVIHMYWTWTITSELHQQRRNNETKMRRWNWPWQHWHRCREGGGGMKVGGKPPWIIHCLSSCRCRSIGYGIFTLQISSWLRADCFTWFTITKIPALVLNVRMSFAPFIAFSVAVACWMNFWSFGF